MEIGQNSTRAEDMFKYLPSLLRRPCADLHVPPQYWKEAIFADDELIELRSDASPSTLQPVQELARRAPNRDPDNLRERDLDPVIASHVHDFDDSPINVDGKAGTGKKTHIILSLSATMVRSPEDTGILDPTIRAAPSSSLGPWQEIRSWEGGTWSTGKMFAATTQVAIVNAAWESKDLLGEDKTAMSELNRLFEKATSEQRHRIWSSVCMAGSFSPW
ncbi:hypothetical protein N7449_008637 [Penicillium cf. viridicatum]|uniref:Uncharacterized protein n=1 Tax=Penicillium cf. viridicatum TaxID=2972119 RepID=A0A9W9JCL5_9EURO|nr:hypothetical protein N7449_008637 [Penicillium cf. viridicatum]